MVDVMEFFAPVLRPDEVLPKYLKKVDVPEADKTFAIVGAFWGLLLGIFVAFIGAIGALFGATLGLNQLATLSAGLGLAAIIIFPIVLAIFSVLGSRFGAWWQTLFARLFNGSGTWANAYYLSSKMVWPLLVAGILLNILARIPIIGGLLAVAWLLYTIYLACTVLAIATKINKIQALISLIVGGFVIFIVFLIIILVLAASVISAIGLAGK